MVDIGRLNVVLSADASQVQQASRAAQEGLKQVEAQATATGAQLDALAAKFAKAQGGTAADWRGVLEKSGMSATAASQALGTAATAATSVAAETTKAGTAAGLMAQHFDLSAGTLVRSAGALVGVGLGLSAAVGLAEQLHQAIVGIVEGQFTWESSLRRTAGLYGDAAAGVVATAAAQSALPDVLGTQQEFLSANLNARGLTSRYGVPQADVVGMTTASGRAAFALGLTDEKARADLQAQFLSGAANGTDIPSLDIHLDPLSVARRLGGTSEQQIQGLTPGQLKDARTLMETEAANRLVIQAGQDQAQGLALSATTALEKAKEQAANTVRTGIEQTLSGQVPFGQAAGEAAVEAQLGQIGGASRGPSYAPSLAQQQAEAAYEKAAEAVQQLTDHLSSAPAALEDTTKKLNALGVEVGGATYKLLGFTGSLETIGSIARGDVAAQAQAAVGGRAIGPSPRYAQSSAALLAGATERADQQAYQSFVAAQARNGRPSGIQEYLRGVVAAGGPEAASARAALDETTRRTAGNLAAGVAGQASDLASRAQTEANARLQVVQIVQDDRRLAVAERLAGLRKDMLGYESQMAPLLLAQANLADRIEVTSRDNLETRKAIIAAEQAALPAQNAVADLDYQQKRTELQAQARQSLLIQGKDVSGLPSFDSLISQHVQGQLDRPGVELAALEAGRPVQLAQRTETAQGLTRASDLADLDAQNRALRDQQIPLEQAARLVAEKEQSISRTLALMDLEDTKAIAAASRDLNAASLVRIQADASARAAEDYANGLDLGATAAERGQAALEKARDALVALGGIQAQANGANERLAMGLGAGGIGPTAGTAGGAPPTLNLTFQISAANVDDVVRQVEDALRRELGSAGLAPAPVSSNLAGARR